MQVQLNSTCNAFGGVGSCQQLPSDSKFADVCKEHDLKVGLAVLRLCCLTNSDQRMESFIGPRVRMPRAQRRIARLMSAHVVSQVDCVYYDEDLVEVAEDPVSAVKEALSHCQLHGLEHACPQCFENQRRLVCARMCPATVAAMRSQLAWQPMSQRDELAVPKSCPALAVVCTDRAQVWLVPERGGRCNAASSREGELCESTLTTAALVSIGCSTMEQCSCIPQHLGTTT